MSSVLVNLTRLVTVRGLSAGAKAILKQLKTLIKKPKKTATDRKKITKLKKELNADKSVKEKKLQAKKDRFNEYVKTPRKIREKGDTKQMKGEEKHWSGSGSKKSEIDHDYYQELNRSLKTGDKMKLPKGGNKKAKEKAFYDELEKYLKPDQKKGFSTGGLSSKNYVNPVTIVDHLNKK